VGLWLGESEDLVVASLACFDGLGRLWLRLRGASGISHCIDIGPVGAGARTDVARSVF